MIKNEIYEGTVSEIKFPNKGVVCTAEGDVIIKGALPGQTVSFKLKKKKNNRMEGTLLEVKKRAPFEIQSPCPHFGICGGCLFQTFPYEEQLKIKSGEIKEILDRAVTGEYEFEGILPSPETDGYRNKMEFSFGNECLGGPLELGMHRSGRFNDVVTVDGCRIADSDYRLIIRKTLDFFKEKDIPFYRKHTEEGYLRHLLIRKGKKTGEILLLIETTTQLDFDMGSYAKMLLSLKETEGSFAGILHLKNDEKGDVVRGENIEILHGRSWLYDEILGLKFKITPFSFFQTNTKGAEVLYGKTREYALSVLPGDRKPVVFDLYSGTGTIAQVMSDVSSHVYGIEIVEEAVEAAKENAEVNDLCNVSFIAGDVLKALNETDAKPDLIILDPPRDGCAPRALTKILDYGVDNIIYISCKITSLERDLKPIQEAGYRVKKAAAVDLFPGTGGVESCVLLERVSNRKADSRIRIDVDLEDYYRIKDAQKNAE